MPNPLPHLSSEDPRFGDWFDRLDAVLDATIQDDDPRDYGTKRLAAIDALAQEVDLPIDQLIGSETHVVPDAVHGPANRKASSRLPVIAKVDGNLLITDGNNRAVGAHLRDEKALRSLLVDVDALEQRVVAEAPVRDFYVDPSVEPGPDEVSTWDPPDRKVIQSPNIEQLARKRIKTSVPLDLVFMHAPTVGDQRTQVPLVGWWAKYLEKYSGIMTAEDFRNAFGQAIKTTPDGITAVFFSNVQPEDKIPMTPWTMVHRIGHAFVDHKTRDTSFRRAYETLGKIEDMEWNYGGILTMKSARDNRMGEGEIPVELIAQYLHDGRIRFPEATDYDEEFEELTLSTGAELPMTLEEYEAITSEANQAVEYMVNQAIGNVVVAP